MTAITPEQLKILMSDLNPNRVSKRTGGGGAQLSYLEAYDVKATLIRVFGIGGFSAECIDTKVLSTTENEGKITVNVLCTVRLTIHQTGAIYTETAAASQTGRQIGEVTDFAIKTAESDALKRAAIYLGTQFGLSLYNNGSTQEVIKVIVAPGQEYGLEKMTPKAAPKVAKNVEEAEKMLQESLGAKPTEEKED